MENLYGQQSKSSKKWDKSVAGGVAHGQSTCIACMRQALGSIPSAGKKKKNTKERGEQVQCTGGDRGRNEYKGHLGENRENPYKL